MSSGYAPQGSQHYTFSSALKKLIDDQSLPRGIFGSGSDYGISNLVVPYDRPYNDAQYLNYIFGYHLDSYDYVPGDAGSTDLVDLRYAWNEGAVAEDQRRSVCSRSATPSASPRSTTATRTPTTAP